MGVALVGAYFAQTLVAKMAPFACPMVALALALVSEPRPLYLHAHGDEHNLVVRILESTPRKHAGNGVHAKPRQCTYSRVARRAVLARWALVKTS